MRRLQDYARFLTWNFGLSYFALWAMTFWTLDHGHGVFSRSGQCHPDPSTALFYWICDPASPMSILATLANTALTLTVWGPVYIAAAAVKADAIVVAVPIVVVHLIGFSTAILVTVRLTLSFFQMLRRLGSRDRAVGPAAGTVPEHSAEPLRLSCGKPRDVFGLRGIAR